MMGGLTEDSIVSKGWSGETIAPLPAHWGLGEIDGLLVSPGNACKLLTRPSDYELIAQVRSGPGKVV